MYIWKRCSHRLNEQIHFSSCVYTVQFAVRIQTLNEKEEEEAEYNNNAFFGSYVYILQKHNEILHDAK